MISFPKRFLEQSSILKALDRSKAVIEFSPEGIILSANENFLKIMGYSLYEIKGLHHKIFLDAKESSTKEYEEFWGNLRIGKFHAKEFKRYDKNKKVVWLEATYNPIYNLFGKPYKIIKYATDSTSKKVQSLEFESQIAAINRSHAIISFSLDGTILDANQNFLDIFEYSLSEIQGKHHSMFIDESYSNSQDYKKFWETLRLGSYLSAEFQRFGKNKKEIWIQSSYNPIFDLNGKPIKVVKYATDITAMVKERQRKKEMQYIIDKEMKQINEALDVANRRNSIVGTASHSTSTKVQEIAAGAEELDASISEIRSQTNTAHKVSQETVQKIEITNKTIHELSNASQKIGDVINLITEIASQTNLLSLNASIEAARAGEFGRGFGIVATEVKKLSDETAGATKEISTQIKNLQAFTGQAVRSIEDIFQTVSSINQITENISKAVEEQTYVSRLIANNMTQAAENVETINVSINEISESTQKISNLAEQVKKASESII